MIPGPKVDDILIDLKYLPLKEFGFAEVDVHAESKLFDSVLDSSGNEMSLEVWMSHGDKVISVPSGFKAIGSSENSSIAIMANEEKNFFGLQFHPEVHHTKKAGPF